MATTLKATSFSSKDKKVPLTPVKTTTTTTKKTTVAKPAQAGQYTNLAGISNSTKKNLNYYGQGYQQSKAVTKAQNYLDSVLKAKPGAFKSAYDKQIKNLYEGIMNRPDFSYDVNKDPLYDVYKHNYMTQGQAAMQDTVGNAAALTGGYGNSWAATAGSQAYQEYLQRLNEMVPELENQAYTRYNQEGDTMRQNLQMAQGLRDTEYGQYRDKVGDWQADRSYAQSAYDSAYSKDYNAWMDMLNHYSNLAGMENSSYHSTQNEKLARDQYNLQLRQYEDALAAQKKKSGGSGGSGGGGRSSGGRAATATQTSGVPAGYTQDGKKIQGYDAAKEADPNYWPVYSLDGSKVTYEKNYTSGRTDPMLNYDYDFGTKQWYDTRTGKYVNNPSGGTGSGAGKGPAGVSMLDYYDWSTGKYVPGSGTGSGTGSGSGSGTKTSGAKTGTQSVTDIKRYLMK